MPKIKTHKGAAKRLKTTGSGKLMKRRAYKSHFLSKKSGARKREFAKDHGIDSTQVKTAKRMLGK